ncbi:MAG: hypothetical protein P1U74_06500 [Legionellaceae bacterium]|nr:hypothetical protein [Legionellaceae bacterium]
MKKYSVAVATLLTTLSSAAIMPVSFAEESPTLSTNACTGSCSCSKCSGCSGSTYCTPGCEGGPGFQDCAGCVGEEGMPGSTCAAETAS